MLEKRGCGCRGKLSAEKFKKRGSGCWTKKRGSGGGGWTEPLLCGERMRWT
jgi:hypothetical protein